MACYLCHQAIEKLLKAVLVRYGELPPRTHDLVALHRRIAGRGGDLGVSATELATWADHPQASRYPGFGDPRADSDLPAMLARAADLFARVRRVVSP